MASIDLKDAFFLVPVHESSRIYLRFLWGSKLFEFTCLPFGLCTAPYVFTKLMKPVVTFLRERKHMSVLYLDDMFCIRYNYTKCRTNVQDSMELLQRLGFPINFQKSTLTPSLKCKFLGFIYDTESFCISINDDKKSRLLSLMNGIRHKTHSKIRDFAHIIGTIVSICPAIKYGWLYTKAFERAKFLALIKQKGNYEARMVLSDSLSSDFDWWINCLQSDNCRNPIRLNNYCMEIYTDASLSGWGAVCNGNKTHGFWSKSEQKNHINFLELLAVYYGLKCFAKSKRNCEILLRVDNTTAISYINRMGGIQFPILGNLAREIWKWCENNDIWIHASYISSSDNVIADSESRSTQTEIEWFLSAKAFSYIKLQFNEPEIDLFATRVNTKCAKYISWFPDPSATAIDAFTLNWAKYYFYAFPPFSLISRVLQKIMNDKATGIVVVPQWKTQPWFPMFTSMLTTEPIIFMPCTDLLLSPSSTPHPLAKNLTLVAGKLSGKLFF